MRPFSLVKSTLRRQFIKWIAVAALFAPLAVQAAYPLKEIRIDWAT